jgi:Predicted hydrolases or acyltransferases (alpha/beta hydrolase superfamily)
MPHLSVPGAELYYETDGPASAPALLLVHAGCANLRMWDPQVPALARDHYVIRFDTRCFGRSTTENVEFRDRQDARDVLDHLGVERAALIGASRGGRISLDLAVETPERVAGVVTIGSGPGGFPALELTDDEDAAFDALDDAYESEDWVRLARLETELWTFGVGRDSAALSPAFVRVAYELNQVNAEHAQERPVSVALEPPAYDRVVDIDVPVLATVGEFDISTAIAQQAYLVDTIPDAEGYIFSDTAHLPSVEHPDEFTEVVTGWLGRHGL